MWKGVLYAELGSCYVAPLHNEFVAFCVINLRFTIIFFSASNQILQLDLGMLNDMQRDLRSLFDIFHMSGIDYVFMQGGENRRILLDLKTILEEVQAEVKREEEKRSELQLQYTRDRCAWQLEKAELKCRIAQVREG